MQNFFIVVLVLASIVIIATTLMMEPKTKAGTAFGLDSNNFGTSIHKPKDALLNRITVIAGVVFVVSLIAILAL